MKSVHALCSLQKSWVQKYCALYNNSRHGVKRLEIYDSEETFSRHAQRKILTLEDCIKVVPALQKHQTNVFEVQTRTQDLQFSAYSFGEMTEWMEALQTVAFGRIPAMGSLKEGMGFIQENHLYSSLEARK